MVIGVLNGSAFSLPVNSEVPEGTQVIAIMPDQMSDSFVLKLYHASFPVVTQGDSLEFIRPQLFERGVIHRWRTDAPREEGQYLVYTSHGRYVVADYKRTDVSDLFTWEFPLAPDDFDVEGYDPNEEVAKWTTIDS